MRKQLLSLALVLLVVSSPAAVVRAAEHWLSNGSTVEVDILMAGTPGSSVWRTGKIVEVNQRMNSYKVDVGGGSSTQ